MNRKDFLKKGSFGLGALVAVPAVITSCNKENVDPNACEPSPTETDGPFPIKTPAELVRENIIGDRVGIPLLINFEIQNTNNNCEPLEGVYVDIWQCDSKGNYSEYGGQLDGDFTNEHFLRGRRMTDASGKASFISIYPGWYPGRAPHLHVEVKSSSDTSLLITQVAFPEDVSKTVYATADYKGDFDTSNKKDGEFKRSLDGNMADSVTGNTTDGYTLTKTIKVAQ